MFFAGAETAAAQDSEDESEQIWQRAKAAEDARPSTAPLAEAGTSTGPSAAQHSSQVLSRLNELSARRLEASSAAAAPPAGESVDKGLPPREADQAGLAKAAGTSGGVGNGHAGQQFGQRQYNSHASNGTEQLKAHAGDSASAAALAKALQAAEDEVAISDDEEKNAEGPENNKPAAHAVHILGNGQRKAKTTEAAAPNTIRGNSGPRTVSTGQPAFEAPSGQVGATGPSAGPAGGAVMGPGFFGGQRPVLERDPEDKMPLIPVLLGHQAAPDLPIKKDEDISASEQALSKPVPANSGPQGSPIESSLEQQRLQQKLRHPVQVSKGSAAAPSAGDAAAAGGTVDGVRDKHINGKELINGTSAAPSVSVRDQRGPKASPSHDDAQAGAAEEDKRMQEEREEDDTPVQYSRDPWAHDPW